MLEEFREKNIKVTYPDNASDDEKNQKRKKIFNQTSFNR